MARRAEDADFVSALAVDRLTLAELAPMMRAMIRDQSYRKTPVGVVVGRYIRWFRNEYGATPSTVRDYEATLARMAITLADKELIEVTTEDLREVIDLWQDKEAKTRAKIASVLHSFWSWCEDENLIISDPARKIRRPKVPKKVAEVLPLTARPSLLAAAKHPRDRLGLFCLLTLGLRRSEMAGIQFRDFDPDRGSLLVAEGKGQKQRPIPLRGPILVELRLCLSADLPHMNRPPEPSDYLLHPVDRRAAGKGPEGQMVWSFHPRPKDKHAGKGIHVWWYHRLWDAGLVRRGELSGMKMHRARHQFAMELRRVAGLDAASYALGHSDVSTTLGIYGHVDETELETAMSKYADWLEEQEG